jgi:hypothetical protein
LDDYDYFETSSSGAVYLHVGPLEVFTASWISVTDGLLVAAVVYAVVHIYRRTRFQVGTAMIVCVVNAPCGCVLSEPWLRLRPNSTYPSPHYI